ncbi:carboxymuconolactone decarboxylase family protein [Streptosporangium sp. NPDC002524]|uniref:carboxymuconolactone decarboxylase family protein n=1 Tax=Streptosporangium sp. NPDC002524 TaxID=3154537 RepID=UPI003324D1B2
MTPVTPEAATGRIAGVYGQAATDFGLARMPVLMTLSPAPDLLAATWALLRESLVAGPASRTGREVVALGVSVANRCPYCVAAHTTLLHATGDHRLAEDIARGGTPADPGHAALLRWATATRTTSATSATGTASTTDATSTADARGTVDATDATDATGTAGAAGAASTTDAANAAYATDTTDTTDTTRPLTAPFPAEHTAEYVGTALTFHFVNRVASSLLTDSMLPGRLQDSRLVRNLGGRVLARTVRRRFPAGESLPLLAGPVTTPEPAWAGGTPVGTAFAALREAAGTGRALLGERARATVLEAVRGWDGEHPAMGGGWLDGPLAGLPGADRPGARLALLAALAPYRVTDADVAAWRVTHPDDADLVRLLAYGAITAVEGVEASIRRALPVPSGAGSRPTPPPSP